jgi:hypothetical protein
MPNEDDARLKHILDAAKEIEHFLANKTEAQFRGDRLLLLASSSKNEALCRARLNQCLSKASRLGNGSLEAHGGQKSPG